MDVNREDLMNKLCEECGGNTEFMSVNSCKKCGGTGREIFCKLLDLTF